MSGFVIGQRLISESEPELGLATVVHAGSDRVRVKFESAGEVRTYTAEQAPLKRVRFRAGDKVRTREDQEFLVKEVIEQQGLLIYVGENQRLPEAQLSDRLSLRGPQERLFAGRFDTSAAFELRRRTLDLAHRSRKSPVRGFLGGRIDLIPHQLYIAQEVANRHAARVMLSDEVGLGKTIEASLILHRLLLSGRADRILVLVPESLVHQWFVEMLRRFNVWLHIFDEERCASIEAGESGANPFLDDQLVLTSISFLAADPRRSAQAVAAGWDVLVVDEAHHLEWSESSPSRAYQVVEELSHKLEDVSGAFCGTTWERKLQKGSPYKLIENAAIISQTLPAMFQTAAKLAETKAAALRQSALDEMNHLLGHEVERLQTLAQVNDHVRPQEIRLAQAQQAELATTLQQSPLRLDSLRLIWKGPPEAPS